MNKHKLEQEHYCLELKYLCDLLRTKLLLIDDFKGYHHYSKELEKIKSQADEIYWSL